MTQPHAPGTRCRPGSSGSAPGGSACRTGPRTPRRCAVVATTDEGVARDALLEPGHAAGPADPAVGRHGRRRRSTRAASGSGGSTTHDGDEYGVWRRQPFGAGPGEGVVDPTGLPAAYSAGLALGRRPRRGRLERRRLRQPDPRHFCGCGSCRTRIRGCSTSTGRARTSAACPATRRSWPISHSEHGDSRHPALRVVCAPTDGATGRRVLGRRRARRCARPASRPSPATSGCWSSTSAPACRACCSGTRSPTPTASAAARADDRRPGRGHRRRLVPGRRRAPGRARPRGPDPALAARPGHGRDDPGRSARRDGVGRRRPPRRRRSGSPGRRPRRRPPIRDGDGAVVLAPLGPPAPGSVAVQDVWADGPGGRVHALLRPARAGPARRTRRSSRSTAARSGTTPTPSRATRAPTSTRATPWSASTTAARPATAPPGGTRSASGSATPSSPTSRAVRDHLVDAGRRRPGTGRAHRLVVGRLPHPARRSAPSRTAWTVGVASVPVADYLAAYEDEMEGLKAFDRALFGGSPDEVPDRYADSSPLTYVESVRAPLLVLAGENDPRCPIRQIENYLARLDRARRAARGLPVRRRSRLDGRRRASGPAARRARLPGPTSGPARHHGRTGPFTLCSRDHAA